ILVGILYWQLRERTTRSVQHELDEATQALSDARSAPPEKIWPLLQKAQERVDVAKKLAIGVFTPEEVQVDLARLEQTCRIDHSRAYSRKGTVQLGLESWKDATDAFRKAI